MVSAPHRHRGTEQERQTRHGTASPAFRQPRREQCLDVGGPARLRGERLDPGNHRPGLRQRPRPPHRGPAPAGTDPRPGPDQPPRRDHLPAPATGTTTARHRPAAAAAATRARLTPGFPSSRHHEKDHPRHDWKSPPTRHDTRPSVMPRTQNSPKFTPRQKFQLKKPLLADSGQKRRAR